MKSKIRHFIVKHFYLDYMTKLYSLRGKFPRAATVIFPSLSITFLLYLYFIVAQNKDISSFIYTVTTIATTVSLISLYLGFIHVALFPIKWEECVDKEQQYQYGAGAFSGTLTKDIKESIDYTEFIVASAFVNKIDNQPKYKPLRMLFMPHFIVPIVIGIALLIINLLPS